MATSAKEYLKRVLKPLADKKLLTYALDYGKTTKDNIGVAVTFITQRWEFVTLPLGACRVGYESKVCSHFLH